MDPEKTQPNYDFIMNSGKTKKRFSFSGESKKQRIIVLLGGIVAVIVIMIIASSLLGASSKKSNENIVDLVSYQAELKRVIGLGTDRSRDVSLKNKAITAKFVLDSDNRISLNMMNARGIKAPKNLATRYSGTATDTLLDNAYKTNDFDAQYEAVYKEKLTNYKTKLADIYPTLNSKEQAIIKLQNQNAKILLGEPIE